MRRASLPFAPLLGLAVAVCPLPAVSQETPAATFGTTVEVRVVNVEAVVTDSSGQRVSSLKPEDFRLLVDGKQVPIEYFSEIKEGALAAPPTQAKAVSLPPSLDVSAASETVGTSYLVFIDEYFPLQIDRDRAVTQLKALVPSLGPRDRMAVVAFDGKGLTKLTDWTASRDTLQAVLDDSMKRPTGGYLRRLERQDAETDVELRNYVKRLREQTQAAVAASTSALRAVRPPAGRKVAILLSGGWPSDPSYLLPASDYRYAERRHLTGSEVFRPLIDTANLLGYTLYPVDLPGLQGSLQNDASERGFDLDQATALQRQAGAGDQPQSPGTSQPTGPEQERMREPQGKSEQLVAPAVRADQREQEDQYALKQLARETGGVAMINAPITAAFVDTRSFYWLGYSPAGKADDARHEVRVEVTNPKLTVRSRQGFVDFSLATETRMRVESALLSGGTEGAGALGVKVGAAQAGERRTVLLPLEITIPTDEVTAISTGDRYRIELELRAAALDEWGRPSDIPVVPVVFTSSKPPAPGGYATYRTTVQLRRGTTDLLVTIYDPRLDRLLAKRVKVEL